MIGNRIILGRGVLEEPAAEREQRLDGPVGRHGAVMLNEGNGCVEFRGMPEGHRGMLIAIHEVEEFILGDGYLYLTRYDGLQAVGVRSLKPEVWPWMHPTAIERLRHRQVTLVFEFHSGPAQARASHKTTDSDDAWDQLFGIQFKLLAELDTLIEQASGERSDAFGAALCSEIIEHVSEKLRFYLHLPASDVKEDQS
jgi:hypothetical protein